MSLTRKLNVGVILELVRLGVSLDRVCGQISAIKNFQSISKIYFDKRFKMTLSKTFKNASIARTCLLKKMHGEY